MKNKLIYLWAIIIPAIVFLLVTELLREKIFFSVFPGFILAFFTAIIIILIIAYKRLNKRSC